MNIDADKLEERIAAILGQIQASVAEYVRTMNEAGALRRREADEAHRQQDEAVKVLKHIECHARQAFQAQSTVASKVAADWLGLVERGLRETAKMQAEMAARTVVTQLENRLAELVLEVQSATKSAMRLTERNELACKSLAWKTLLTACSWLFVLTIAAKTLLA